MKPGEPRSPHAVSPAPTPVKAAPPAPRPNVAVRIERLVLDGISLGPGDAGRIRASVEAELGRLLADGEISPAFASGAAVPEVGGGAIELDQGGPGALGRRIARAVYRGIGP
jgi:hypothetical protein